MDTDDQNQYSTTGLGLRGWDSPAGPAGRFESDTEALYWTRCGGGGGGCNRGSLPARGLWVQAPLTEAPSVVEHTRVLLPVYIGSLWVASREVQVSGASVGVPTMGQQLNSMV